MEKEKREKEPYFIKFANSPPVAPMQPATGDMLNQFADTLLKAKVKAKGPSRVEETHARLVNLLTLIIKNQKIEDGEDLRFFLGAYDTPEVRTFTFENEKVVRTNAQLVYPSTFAVHSFVEFLASQNLRKLKKCPDCTKFFVAVKNNPRQRYCPVCSKKNHTPAETQAERTRISREAVKKRKQRELFNFQYTRLIKSGHSMKEARQGAKEYVIEQGGAIE